MTPAVSKTLEIGLVVLFVGSLTTVLFGAVVPEYETTSNERVSERVLSTAGSAIEDSVPPDGTEVESSRRVELPARIGDREYSIRFDGRELVLDHPGPQVSERIRLVFPPRVDAVRGEWHSGTAAVVHVYGDADGFVVELREGSP